MDALYLALAALFFILTAALVSGFENLRLRK